MPSPFPGMDPYIEAQPDCWPEFHSSLVNGIRYALVPRVRPNYEVRSEKHVYLTNDEESALYQVRPDVHIADAKHGWRDYARPGTASLEAPPRTMLLKEPFEQLSLKLVDTADRRVITVIEVLAPSDKSSGSDHLQYLQKRINLGRANVNLVEIDLLRGGNRLATTEPLPAADFYAYVTRAGRFPAADVYAWTLRDRLPTLPVPLKPEDGDVGLDLQPIFDDLYDRAGYDYALSYTRPVLPTLSAADTPWVADLVVNRPIPEWMRPEEQPGEKSG